VNNVASSSYTLCLFKSCVCSTKFADRYRVLFLGLWCSRKMVTCKTRTCNGSFKNLWFLTYPAFGFLSGGNLQVVTIHLSGETVRVEVMIWFITLSYNLFDIYKHLHSIHAYLVIIIKCRPPSANLVIFIVSRN